MNTLDASRTTDFTYFYNTSKNMVVNYPNTQNVSAHGDTFTTTYRYDANGNLTTLNRYGVQTTFGYTNGNMTSRKNARNMTTTFQYTRGTVSKITNPKYSITRSITWEGKIKSEINGRGYTTRFAYDSLNRIILVDPPEGTSTTISYDNSSGSFRKVTTGANFTRFNIDGLRRITDTSGSEEIKTDIDYNTCGQKTFASYPYTSSNIGDTFTYDILDRMKRITHPDGTSQNQTYSGSNVSIRNERGITVTYQYKAFGDPEDKRLTGVVDATGTTNYKYNGVGRLEQITHPDGLTRRFVYNSKNFMTSEIQPETGTLRYGHDALGNITSKQDGKGTTSYVYDDINRLTKINYPGTVEETSFTYDNADNRKSMINGSAKHNYTYDSLNRLKSDNVSINGKSFLTRYTYNTQGNLQSLEYPTGRIINYFYDSADRVKEIPGYVSNIFYHPSGGIDHLQFSNGKQTDYSYDNRYRVKTQRVPSVMDDTYTYDEVGNVTSITGSHNRAMSYDDMDRLINAKGVWGFLSFTYSAVGNRKTQTLNGSITRFNYSSISNRLTSISGAASDSFTYDANGNMTSVRGRFLNYNPLNQLVEATHVNACCVDYAYDGDGRRIKKVDNVTGKTTLYLHDFAGNILAETEPDGTPYAEYIYLNGQRIAKVVPPDTTAPSTPSDLAATTMSDSQIDLSWTSSTDNIKVTGYEIERCESPGCSNFRFLLTVIDTNYSDTGLSSNTTYRYRVRALDGSGNASRYSSSMSSTTEPTPDTTPPTVPSNLVATAIGSLQINLTEGVQNFVSVDLS